MFMAVAALARASGPRRRGEGSVAALRLQRRLLFQRLRHGKRQGSGQAVVLGERGFDQAVELGEGPAGGAVLGQDEVAAGGPAGGGGLGIVEIGQQAAGQLVGVGDLPRGVALGAVGRPSRGSWRCGGRTSPRRR